MMEMQIRNHCPFKKKIPLIFETTICFHSVCFWSLEDNVFHHLDMYIIYHVPEKKSCQRHRWGARIQMTGRRSQEWLSPDPFDGTWVSPSQHQLCSCYSPCRKQAHLSRTELREALSPSPLHNNNNNNNPSSSLVSSSSNNKKLHHCATSWNLFYMQFISLSSWQPKETQRVVADQYIALMSTGKVQPISLYSKK